MRVAIHRKISIVREMVIDAIARAGWQASGKKIALFARSSQEAEALRVWSTRSDSEVGKRQKVEEKERAGAEKRRRAKRGGEERERIKHSGGREVPVNNA